MGTRLIFRVFFTFQTLKCSLSRNILAKPCGFIRGICVLLLKVPGEFHHLSPKHLDVTSSSLVPNFYNFSENRLLLDPNKSGEETVQITESFFIFVGISQYFRERSNLTFIFLSSCKQMLQPFKHNVVWIFLAKNRRHQTLLYSGFSGKIGKVEYLRRHFNRMTISYKCGTWLIRFVS